MTGRIVLAMLGLSMGGLLFSVSAQAQNLTVTIDGTTRTDATNPCVPLPPGADKCVRIDGSYAHLSIAPISGAAFARVEVPNDAGSDTLRLVNSRITASTTVSNVHIIFQYQHSPNPLINYYKANTIGISSATPGNSITMTAWYTSPPGNPAQQIGQTRTFTCASPGCSTAVNLATSTAPTRLNPGANQRILKMDSTLTMAQGSTLDLSTGQKTWDSVVPDEKVDGQNGKETGEEKPRGSMMK